MGVLYATVLFIPSCGLLGSLLLLATNHVSASTAAFCGTITKTAPAGANEKDALASFTVEINYFDYISWGKFGRHSKPGDPITRRVKKLGTACVINGRLVNAATFAKAIRPGNWGYFYEDTWLDMQTTPDFQWGEVVKRDSDGQFTLRVHRTHKDYHLETKRRADSKGMRE